MRTWLGRWWWAVAGVVVIATVATVVVVVSAPGPDVSALERVLDVEAPGGRAESAAAFGALVDEESAGIAYFARSARGRTWVEARRVGQEEPLWTSTVDVEASGVELAEVDDVLLVMSTCSRSCDPLVGLDGDSGEQLWTGGLAVVEVMGHADGYAAVRLTDGEFVDGVAAVELRSGRIAWKEQRAGALDRFEVVPERGRVAHYSAEGRLRLLDLATGGVVASAVVPPFPDGGSVELSTSADEVVLQVAPPTGPAASTVHDVEDLRERWSHDGRVHALAPGRLFAGAAADRGQVVDAEGRPRWRVEGTLFRGVEDGSWVFTTTGQASTGGERITYFELATGRRVAEDDHVIAFREPAGVVQVNSEFAESDVLFWYLALPSGEAAELGTLNVFAASCAYGHTHLACLDTDGRVGMWRYR